MSEIINGPENKSRRRDPGVVKKKSGAQPHNTNALRHGFYSRQFKALELEDLAAIDGNLDDEIAMLRVVNRRVFEFANKNEPATLDDWLKVLSVHGLTDTRIANLLKLRSLMEMPKDDDQTDISKAIAEAIKDLGAK